MDSRRIESSPPIPTGSSPSELEQRPEGTIELWDGLAERALLENDPELLKVYLLAARSLGISPDLILERLRDEYPQHPLTLHPPTLDEESSIPPSSPPESGPPAVASSVSVARPTSTSDLPAFDPPSPRPPM
jgi:hypothetical protein